MYSVLPVRVGLFLLAAWMYLLNIPMWRLGCRGDCGGSQSEAADQNRRNYSISTRRVISFYKLCANDFSCVYRSGCVLNRLRLSNVISSLGSGGIILICANVFHQMRNSGGVGADYRLARSCSSLMAHLDPAAVDARVPVRASRLLPLCARVLTGDTPRGFVVKCWTLSEAISPRAKLEVALCLSDAKAV